MGIDSALPSKCRQDRPISDIEEIPDTERTCYKKKKNF